MSRRPTLEVVIVDVAGGRIVARRLDDNRRATIGTYEEFGAPLECGEILCIPDDLPARDWL